MIEAIMAFDGTWGVNLYAAYATMRANLDPGKKGAERDVEYVFGATADIDNDKEGQREIDVESSYDVESSPGNFQRMYLFDRPLPAIEAKPVLIALHAAIGGDSAQRDISHVWRIPGTLNWPTKSKLARGRSPEPFLVNVAKPCNGVRVDPAVLLGLAPVKGARKERKARNTAEDVANGHSGTDSPFSTVDLPPYPKIQDNLVLLRSALEATPACCDRQKVWFPALCALNSLVPEWGEEYPRAIALWWSKRCPEQFSQHEFDKAWNSLDPLKPNGNTIKTLFYKAREHGWTEPPPPPPVDREALLLAAWINRDIPPRDYLLGNVMCTTSRWFIFGETGIGKTLLCMDLGAAIAAAMKFLNWPGRRRARVMYLDGELPVETFKERMQLIAARYGEDLKFYGYNRDALGDDAMPPLNTDPGQAWLRREIDAIKPDLIIFDSIMCLIAGSMSEEATWIPVRSLVRELTRRHIAQIWAHHANDSGKSFGDKTREWEMDTVAFLSHPPSESGEPNKDAIKLEFRKARLKNPENADQFESVIIRPGENWKVEPAPRSGERHRAASQIAVIRSEYLNAYNRLADSVRARGKFVGEPVKRIEADAIKVARVSRC